MRGARVKIRCLHAPRDDGRPGEDELFGVENVIGGSGDDVIRGETIGAARGRRHRVVLRLNARDGSLRAREPRLAVRIEYHENDDVEGLRTVLRRR